MGIASVSDRKQVAPVLLADEEARAVISGEIITGTSLWRDAWRRLLKNKLALFGMFAVIIVALASFVGYSRVESREHYAHDVVAGAAVGILSSCLFTKPYRGWNLELEAESYFRD